MTHIESIKKGVQDNMPYTAIIRKVYLTYPTKAFEGAEEKQFAILDEISNYFSIPIINVQIAGSAKTGRIEVLLQLYNSCLMQ